MLRLVLRVIAVVFTFIYSGCSSKDLVNHPHRKSLKSVKNKQIRVPKPNHEKLIAKASAPLSIARKTCEEASSEYSCIQKYLTKYPRYKRLVYSSSFQVAYYKCHDQQNQFDEYECIRNYIKQKPTSRLKLIP